MKQNFKNKKAITLVALVVTIVILLILAGISISTLINAGIFGKAQEAKEKYQIANEQEAINLILISKKIEKDNEYIGKKLYSKNFINSDKWDYIVTMDNKKNYGDGWYYIKKDTELSGYGKIKNEWLVNYDTNEMVKLKENNFVELSINNIILTDGLIFNIDSNDITISDKNTWGEGVELYGFENNTDVDAKGALYFDGIDDYVSFKSGGDFEKGFTFSFYGIPYNSFVFAKQKGTNVAYSCRIGWGDGNFSCFNISKNRANSNWSLDDNYDNGILCSKYIWKVSQKCYCDLTFDPIENKFILYNDGKKVDETYVDEGYWHGKNGGRQIFEDDSIDCYVGRWFGGTGKWHYKKIYIYNMKLYNKYLTPEEIEENYIKTMAYHND